MPKSRKNKKGLAEKWTKKNTTKAPNPFDFKINKQKHVVLGRNQNLKNQVGNPGRSKSKAYQQRKNTLLTELKEIKKKNVFMDQRLGEKIAGLSSEERSIQRLAHERKSLHKRLQDEDGEADHLTHRGQSLAEIEQFEEVESDSDDDGRLGGKVAEEHFGGFLTQKPGSEKLKWKDRMAELIAETKKRKYERQTEKDEVKQKTDEVDEEFMALHHLLIKKSDAAAPKRVADAYDIKMKTIQFEAKRQPSDRLKTEEELAKEEAERLKKLEAERIRRMKGDLSSKESTHVSADSLDDGYTYMPLDEKKDEEDVKDDNSNDEEEEEEEDGEEEGSDEDDDDESEDDDEEESEDEDSEDDEEAERAVEKLLQEKLEKKEGPKSILKNGQKTVDPEVKKRIAEEAKNEMPYTFKAPSDLEDLEALLGNYNSQDQVTVVERLVACHHPSLAEGNKEKLVLLFSLLLQYLMKLMAGEDPPVQMFDRLTPVLHRLLRYNTEVASKTVSQLLLKRHKDLEESKGRGRVGLDTLLLLKLVHVLYPTSDFKHPVVTPAFYLIANILHKMPLRSGRNIAVGLFLCSLCSEYVVESRRYIPEVINFLHSLLVAASASKDEKKVGKSVQKAANLLTLTEKVKNGGELSVKMFIKGTKEEELTTPEFRAGCISTCVRLLQEFSHLYSDQPATIAIFAPCLNRLDQLPSTLYPQGLQDCVQHLKATLVRDAGRPLTALRLENKKVEPLKMLEPQIEESFDGRKKRKGTREQLERQRLQHKVKKEFKSAMREIRKDNQFLAREKLKSSLQKDEERKNKLKRIYADLSSQEGDCRALKRKKDRASS